VLRRVSVIGASSVPPETLARTWQHEIGADITVRQVYDIATAIGAACGDAGLMLYQITVPQQSFADGEVRIDVVEGHVGDVVIQGDVQDADLTLLKHYAARIVADHPLHRAILEREILLMNRIEGLHAGSKFVPLPGEPGAARLLLTIRRTRIEALAGVNNQGVSDLSREEIYAGVAVNGLLQEGDRTELLFGAPPQVSRYQFYGLSHVAPLGDNGATLRITLGDLVTRPVGNGLSGNAFVAGVAFSQPIILSLRESLVATAAFDLLDSNDALLGTTLTDERTRALRGGLTYTRLDDWEGIDAANITLSQGIDVFGARAGNVAYGGPVFTKINLAFGRTQPLPWGLVVRVRTAGQYSLAHLPASEQFVYGTTNYGQAFTANPLYGDRGVTAYAELAHSLAWATIDGWVTGTELYGFCDWGEVWNTQTVFLVNTDRAASAGIGVRAVLHEHLTVQVAAVNAVVTPDSVPRPSRWGAVFSVQGHF
jgi:hemolysin activation/secretion protein